GLRHTERRRTVRFIPTCVGSTRHANAVGRRTAVHPHVRGVHVSTVSIRVLSSGSSPRAWGPRSGEGRRSWVHRFIPTCVGSTRRVPPGPPPQAVHPHVRGVHRVM